MTPSRLTRRGALRLALGGFAGLAGGSASATRGQLRLHRRVGVAFGATVSITLEAANAAIAEGGFAAGFAEIRRIDRLSSLTRPESEVFRLNREGFFDRPDPDLLAMLGMARAMHAATDGAFDVTVQPMWLAFDAAASRGSWPSNSEIADLRRHVDQNALVVTNDRIEFSRPDMAITLNSLARGVAADRVADALAHAGIANALFDTDVLGSLGQRPDGAPWRAIIRHPRRPEEHVGASDLRGCLATSGDYQYFWSADYARNHIIDPRRGAAQAPALLKRFGAEALFVDKAGIVTQTSGFPDATL